MSSFDSSEVSLIVPENDLESRTIIEIARRIGIADIRISCQKWGARLDQEPVEMFQQLKTNVLIVEMPGPEIEKKLEEDGHKITVIDHHRYQDLDRSKPKSALDQFAEHFGYELSEWERWVALNDRKYLWGLMEADVPYPMIRCVRRNDMEAQGYDESTFEAERQEYLATEIKLKEFFEGQHFIYVHRTKLDRSGYFTDLFHLPDESAYRKFKLGEMDLQRQNLLILREEDKSTEIRFSGREEALDFITRLLSPLSDQSWSGGQDGFRFAGFSISPERKENVSAVLFTIASSALPERDLSLERLEKFTTFFLFPFAVSKNLEQETQDHSFEPDEKEWERIEFSLPLNPSELKEGAQGKSSWTLCQHYAEYIYFHDYVRSFLFPSQSLQSSDHGTMDEVARFYRFTGLEFPSLLELETNDGKRLTAFINGICLHFYPGGVGVLTFEMSNEPETKHEEDEASKIERDFKVRYSIISRGGDLLLFHNMLRRVYPSYFEKDDFDAQAKNKDFPRRIRILNLSGKPAEAFQDLEYYDPHRTFLLYNPDQKRYYPTVTRLILRLLPGLMGAQRTLPLHPVLDDRMLIHTYLAFPEQLYNLTTGRARDVFFSRLLYVDNPGHNYRYNPAFIEPEMAHHAYTRWEHYGTKYGFTRFASVFVYFGNDGSLYRPVTSMYYQMFLLIVYFRSRLIQFSDEIARIAQKSPDPNRSNEAEKKKFKDSLRALHRRFMHFMNRFWFVEVTNQDQGIEIFQLMRKAFEIEPMYSQVKDEIERADELTELLHNEDVERFNTRVGLVGAIWGFLAILTGFLGMNFEPISNWGKSYLHFYFVFLAIIILLMISAWIIFIPDPNRCTRLIDLARRLVGKLFKQKGA